MTGRAAIFSHAPASDLTPAERCDLFDHLERFKRWCRLKGYRPDVRVLPPDPEGHAERRSEHGCV